ncbi:MAG: CpsD/CapB family tyrosine-protein kinase [Lachnospiraceae bacterium]|nr:CpsD/CapB family tyrosine-protein kinase [Lachnospiraceae bacterium]
MFKIEKKNAHQPRKFLLMTKSAPFQYQEAFKSLRTNLKFIALGKECKRLIITSAIPGEGKSSVAINLAISLAQAGSKVLIMDCDLRKPILHKYLKISRTGCSGLTSVLSGNSLDESIINIADLKLHVMIADAIPPNPAELLGSARMKNVIEEMAHHYDFIIFDTPPVSVVTDAAVLSQYADGVILVVRQNFATFEQVELAKKNLDQVNAVLLGAVMNNYDAKSADKESGYYYSYNYDYSSNDTN